MRNTKDFALEIAELAFENKVDLSGEPYFDHVKRVWQKVESRNEDVQIVAILHDLLEDCPEWNEKLLRYFFYKSVVDAIVALTKIKGEPYEDYIDRVSINHYARLVKIADLEDNMNVSRLKELKEKDVKRLQKYIKAYQYLTTRPPSPQIKATN